MPHHLTQRYVPLRWHHDQQPELCVLSEDESDFNLEASDQQQIATLCCSTPSTYMWSLNDRFYEASVKRAFCATGTVKVLSECANFSPYIISFVLVRVLIKICVNDNCSLAWQHSLTNLYLLS